MILFGSFVMTSYGQLRHIQGYKAVGLNAGPIEHGYAIGATYYHYFGSKQIVKGELAWEKLNFENSKWNVYYIEPQYLYTAWKYKSWYFLNLKAGFMLGFENGDNSILNESISNFFLGEDFGFENEFFFNDKFSSILGISQRFLQKSDLGNSSWAIKIGVNYNF